jgi:hypothetical protein
MVPRWVMWSIAAVVLACAAGLIVVVAVGHSGGDDTPPAQHPDAKALTAYTQALRAPTSQGGQVVQEQMKPSIGEFEQGQVDPGTFVSRARGWQLAMQRVKDQIDKIPVPPFIAAAGGYFDQSMDAYIAAARLFEQAATVPEAQRQAAIAKAITQAQAADHLFDQAAVVVQRALAAAGLPPDDALPNPTPTPPPS